MMKIKRKYWVAIGVTFACIFFLFGIPSLINHYLLEPAKFKFVGQDIDWLNFWGTYIGAFASFAMVLITAITLKQNKDQLSAMKFQWREERRPQLSAYCTDEYVTQIGTMRKHEKMAIEITNLGHSIATNISLYTQLKFKNDVNLPNEIKELTYNFWKQKDAFLLPNEVLRIPLCWEEIDKNSIPQFKYIITDNGVKDSSFKIFLEAVDHIHLTGTYNDQYDNQYKVDTKIYPSMIKRHQVNIVDTLSKVEQALLYINLTLREQNGTKK